MGIKVKIVFLAILFLLVLANLIDAIHKFEQNSPKQPELVAKSTS